LFAANAASCALLLFDTSSLIHVGSTAHEKFRLIRPAGGTGGVGGGCGVGAGGVGIGAGGVGVVFLTPQVAPASFCFFAVVLILSQFCVPLPP
jgi:hypothetical protein